MKAIVIGGSGATGKELIRHLLADPRFQAVTALVRKPFFDPHAKLTEVIVDFESLSNYSQHIQGDVAFSCLGTTLKDAGSKAAQWRVDHDYQLEFATLAKANGVESFVLLSAIGASPKSSIFYSRMKGELEESIQKLDFTHLVICKPGAIDRPGTTRAGEKAMINVLRMFNSIGLFKRYAPITTDHLAQSLITSYFNPIPVP